MVNLGSFELSESIGLKLCSNDFLFLFSNQFGIDYKN